MENMKDTQWDFALVLRQKYQEEIFRRRLRELGVSLEAPVELTKVAVDEAIPQGGYKITAVTKNGVTGEEETIICKYLVGADGGRSFVRRALDVPFDGSTTEDKWVRIDGIIETNMPKSRVYGAIESPTHGNVLWAALDHGATRIVRNCSFVPSFRLPTFTSGFALGSGLLYSKILVANSFSGVCFHSREAKGVPRIQ